ncbi:ABC transporter permease [Niabella sp. CC-SYL272]|uniref:ABC transporter permease n=1 Tax=Niabella agricola TaxID=2891571 RepID=UPI001F2CB39A|nr:ABC transporter permease [Niabella agricola]MCF3107473.1 ABC transporter permease [Niabella agricola]
MFKNDIKIALRNSWRDRFYSGLNLLGLAVAIATFLLIINYVRFERSYEAFHKNAANMYRVTVDMYKGSEYVGTDCETYPPLGPMLVQTMPEVIGYVRLQDLGTVEVQHRDRAVLISKAYAADASVFSVFSYSLLRKKQGVLSSPDQLVITAAVAQKLFGTIEVLDKTVRVKDRLFTIAGVAEDIPANTHLKFEMLLPFDYIKTLGFDPGNWNGNNNFTYLLMKPGTGLNRFNEKLRQFSHARLKHEVLKAEPVKDIHLYSNKSFEPEANGSHLVVDFLMMIALLILFIGVANYINITTARLVERSKNVSVRKVLGSSRWSLVKLFFTESLIMSSVAFVLALLLVQVSMPAYRAITGVGSGGWLWRSAGFWMFSGVLFVLICLLAGLYPALLASAVKITAVTRRTFTGLGKGTRLRKVLVLGQFTAALAVSMCAAVIYQQIRFVRSRNLGMNMEQVLVIKGPLMPASDSLQRVSGQRFKNDLRRIPGIRMVAFSSSLPGADDNTLNTQTDVRRLAASQTTGYNYYLYGVDEDFLPVLNNGLIAGRNFFEAPVQHNEVIINEEACRLLGFETPAAAIGAKIKVNSGPVNVATVIGVNRNYRQQSLKQAQHPLILWHEQGIYGYFTVKLVTGEVHQVLQTIAGKWKEDFPGHTMDYFFMDEMYNRQYQQDIRFGKLVNVFSVITLFIACLSLLGLSVLNTSMKTKEIGIRKVMGAGFSEILALLSVDFLKLVVLAVLLSVPVTLLAMHAWLQNFSDRISIQWWLFPLMGAFVLGIALVTILLQAFRTIKKNPVEALRTE